MDNIQKSHVNIPDGIYQALWHGHLMEIFMPTNNKTVIIESNVGLKGSCKVNISLMNGIVAYLGLID